MDKAFQIVEETSTLLDETNKLKDQWYASKDSDHVQVSGMTVSEGNILNVPSNIPSGTVRYRQI